MVAWSGGLDGVPELEEMAKTGANAVRIVWVSTAPAAALDLALQSARSAGLVPVVELHDGQGDFSALPRLVDFWTAPETVAVLARHEQALLVEIGGGLGGAVPRAQWEEGYRRAIAELRSAGIRAPIVVHAPQFGNDTTRLLESAPTLLAADPGRNLLFAFSAWTGTAEDAIATLEQLSRAGVPVFVAEFSAYLINDCPSTPFDYPTFLEATARLRIGWFAWSWGGVENSNCPGALDMTSDGTFSGLQGWGLEVGVADPFGISQTSSLVAPECGADR